MPRVYLIVLLAALVAIPVVSCRGETTAAQAVPQSPKTTPETERVSKPARSGDMMESCDSLPLTEKEACYARQAPGFVAECERMRLHHCAPYARMHALEKQLEQLNADLLQAARRTYASYEDSQPGYVKDVEQRLVDADRTWRAYRDASCNLEPFIQGMSRDGTADLTEACRAGKTSARIDGVEEMISGFKEETDGEQRKQ